MDKEVKTKTDQLFEAQQDNVVYTCGGFNIGFIISFLFKDVEKMSTSNQIKMK